MVSRVSVALAGLVLVLAGCGGGGNSVNLGETVTRQSIARAVQEGFSSKRTGDSGGTRASRAVPTRADAPVFRPEYGLWASAVEGGIDFYVDEALTELGGTERSTYTFEGSNFSSTNIVQLTAGILSGLKITATKGYVDGTLTFSLVTESPTDGKSTESGSWKDGVGEFQTTIEDLTGATRTYRVRFFGDGSAEVSYPNANSFTYTLTYRSDSSGTGTVTGSSDLLPASLEWDATGTGVITFADGSKLDFVNYEFNGI